MGPNLVVVRGIGFQDSALVCLSEHDYMIEAVSHGQGSELHVLLIAGCRYLVPGSLILYPALWSSQLGWSRR